MNDGIQTAALVLGGIIAHHRKQAGIRQARLALVMGLSKVRVSRIENGEALVNAELGERLARHLGFTRLDVERTARRADDIVRRLGVGKDLVEVFQRHGPERVQAVVTLAIACPT